MVSAGSATVAALHLDKLKRLQRRTQMLERLAERADVLQEFVDS